MNEITIKILVGHKQAVQVESRDKRVDESWMESIDVDCCSIKIVLF